MSFTRVEEEFLFIFIGLFVTVTGGWEQPDDGAKLFTMHTVKKPDCPPQNSVMQAFSFHRLFLLDPENWQSSSYRFIDDSDRSGRLSWVRQSTLQIKLKSPETPQ